MSVPTPPTSGRRWGSAHESMLRRLPVKSGDMTILLDGRTSRKMKAVQRARPEVTQTLKDTAPPQSGTTPARNPHTRRTVSPRRPQSGRAPRSAQAVLVELRLNRHLGLPPRTSSTEPQCSQPPTPRGGGAPLIPPSLPPSLDLSSVVNDPAPRPPPARASLSARPAGGRRRTRQSRASSDASPVVPVTSRDKAVLTVTELLKRPDVQQLVRQWDHGQHGPLLPTTVDPPAVAAGFWQPPTSTRSRNAPSYSTTATTTAAPTASAAAAAPHQQTKKKRLKPPPTTDLSVVWSTEENPFPELQWAMQRWLANHGRKDGVSRMTNSIHLLRNWFDHLDSEKRGAIGVKELEEPMISVGLAFSRADVIEALAAVDENASGDISFDEFISLMSRPTVPSSSRAPVVSQDLEITPDIIINAAREHELAKAVVGKVKTKITRAKGGVGGGEGPSRRSSLSSLVSLSEQSSETAGGPSSGKMQPHRPTLRRASMTKSMDGRRRRSVTARRPNAKLGGTRSATTSVTDGSEPPTRATSPVPDSGDVDDDQSPMSPHAVPARRDGGGRRRSATGRQQHQPRAAVTAARRASIDRRVQVKLVQQARQRMQAAKRKPVHSAAVATTAADDGGAHVVDQIENPVLKLFKKLNSGKLGDKALPFSVLITAYRRRMLLDACMAPKGSNQQMMGQRVLEAIKRAEKLFAWIPEDLTASALSSPSALANQLQQRPPRRGSVASLSSAMAGDFDASQWSAVRESRASMQLTDAAQSMLAVARARSMSMVARPASSLLVETSGTVADYAMACAQAAKDGTIDVAPGTAAATPREMKEFLTLHRKPAADMSQSYVVAALSGRVGSSGSDGSGSSGGRPGRTPVPSPMPGLVVDTSMMKPSGTTLSPPRRHGMQSIAARAPGLGLYGNAPETPGASALMAVGSPNAIRAKNSPLAAFARRHTTAAATSSAPSFWSYTPASTPRRPPLQPVKEAYIEED